MQTTLDIDDDVLAAAKEIAAGRNTTAGKVISELVREALLQPAADRAEPEYRDGFRLLPRTGMIITPELVEQLLEEDA